MTSFSRRKWATLIGVIASATTLMIILTLASMVDIYDANFYKDMSYGPARAESR